MIPPKLQKPAIKPICNELSDCYVESDELF